MSGNELLETLQGLRHDVVDLTGQVETLTGRLSAKEILAKRTHNLTVLALGAIVLVGVAIGLEAVQVAHNGHVATVNCQNANESRKANRELWRFIIEAKVGDPDTPVADVRRAQVFGQWVYGTEGLYRGHDCNDLTRKYPVPPPPKLGP
jgi:hypothetical protein